MNNRVGSVSSVLGVTINSNLIVLSGRAADKKMAHLQLDLLLGCLIKNRVEHGVCAYLYYRSWN